MGVRRNRAYWTSESRRAPEYHGSGVGLSSNDAFYVLARACANGIRHDGGPLARPTDPMPTEAKCGFYLDDFGSRPTIANRGPVGGWRARTATVATGVRFCGYKMAVDGSRWQFLGRSPAVSPRATRSTTNSLDGKRIGRIGHGNLARLRFVRGFQHGGSHVTVVGETSRATFPSLSIYNIRAFAEFVNAPTPCALIPVAGVNAERT